MKRMVAATVLLASLATLVAGLAAVNALAASHAVGPSHRWGWGRGGGGFWHNYTQVTISEDAVEGVVVDADWGYLVVNTNNGEVRLAAPHLWTVQGQRKTWFKLFADDSLNIGDRVRATVLSITVTKPSGVTTTARILKSISDLSTGVEASAILPQNLPSTSTA
ncbi:MAG: hypothetical protein QW470_00740 [Candidatus Caldarchaeum sp.]